MILKDEDFRAKLFLEKKYPSTFQNLTGKSRTLLFIIQNHHKETFGYFLNNEINEIYRRPCKADRAAGSTPYYGAI